MKPRLPDPVVYEEAPFDPNAEMRRVISEQAKVVLRDGAKELIRRMHEAFEDAELRKGVAESLQEGETLSSRFADGVYAALAKDVFFPAP